MNTNKNILAFLLLVLLILSAIYYNKYFRTVNTNEKITYENNGDKQNNITNKGKIIQGESSEYKNLTDDEKNIMNNIYELRGGADKADYPVENSLLKYYDDNIAIICFFSAKPGSSLEVYNLKSRKLINTDNATSTVMYPYIGNSYLENEKYVVSVQDEGILYYKVGNSFFKTLSNSILLSKTETYTKMFSMLNEYQISLATSSNILKVGIFKKDLTKEFNTKLREVEYVLP